MIVLARRPAILLAVAFAAALAVVVIATGGRAADERGILADLLSRALSTPTSRVSIGNIDGALSSDATIHDVELSDRDGVWLRLDRARIVWRRLALLSRRLEIDTLEVDHLAILRRPAPAETPVAGEDQPLLPELPLKVEVKSFSLAELLLGEPLLGAQARLAAQGAAKLGPPSEGLDLKLDVRRLDQPGTANARLSLVPDGQRLTLALKLDEGPGGIVARAANIPGLPPVTLDLDGKGTLDSFGAKLALDAGPDVGATGSATLERQGPARQLALELAAKVSGLLPGPVAPVFAGQTRLAGKVGFADDGSVSIPGVTLTAAAARLDIAGAVTADRKADIRVTAANLPTGEGRTSVSGVEIGRLAFDARVTGDIAAPGVDATLTAENARLPAGRLDHLDARFQATPDGTAPGGVMQIRMVADARATGLALTDRGLAQAVGSEASLSFRGTRTAEGIVAVDALDLKSPTLTGRFSGRAGPSDVTGKVAIDAPDLARFGAAAGLALRGSATLSGDVAGVPRANRFAVKLDGHASRFATGKAIVDGLIGGKFDIAGGARLEPDGTIGFDDMRLDGVHAGARLNGAAGHDRADLTALMTVPDLAYADRRLSGRASIDARITGTLGRPDVTAKASVTDARALNRPIPRLVLDATVKDVLGAPDAVVTLDGEIDGKPARGSIHALRRSDGSAALDPVDVAIGSAAIRGKATLDAANLADGRLTLTARDLGDLSPLLLQETAGALDADIALTVANGGQNAAFTAHGAGIAIGGVKIERLDADLSIADAYRRPVLAGTAAVDRADIAGERIDRVRLNASGTPQASDVTLTATARGFDLDARARIVPGDRTTIELSRVVATKDRQRIALAEPATLTLVDGGIDIRILALGVGGGRLSVVGRAGSRLDLRLDARAIPLSVAEMASPGIGLSGTLDGSAALSGTPSDPSGSWRARIANLVVKQARDAGAPPLGITANGEIANRRTTVDATIAAPGAGSVRINGQAPLDKTGAFDLAIRGSLDAGIANRSLGASGRRVTGRVAIDARVEGTADAPRASGSATLSGGTFSDAAQGIALERIQARAVARGDAITIDSASATTKNGGTINATGRVTLAPDAGFPGNIRITGRNAQVVQSALATAIVNLDLTLSGALARDPRIAGRVGIVSLDVPVPERLPASLQPLPGTRNINLTPAAKARLALNPQRRGARRAPPFNASLDIALDAPGHILVHGRGLNAELGGSLHIGGTLAEPKPTGAFSFQRGRLNILAARLDFSRGNLTFAGDLTPELDFVASMQSGSTQVGVEISGPASDPRFTFTSTPDMPQNEILSRILFGTSSGQLSTGQAIVLAQTAAQFSGDSAFEQLRRSLGLSGLDLNLGASGGPGVGLQRALNDRISVGVKAGASAAQTGVGVDIRVTDRIKLQGQVDSNGAKGAGVGAEWEW